MQPLYVMDKFKLFCGIDISKADFDAVYGTPSDYRHVKLTNDAKGISQLIKLLLAIEADPFKILVYCENTSSFLSQVACALKAGGVFLWAAHPLLLSYYSIELERLKKIRPMLVR